jgi:hypothetical protein
MKEFTNLSIPLNNLKANVREAAPVVIEARVDNQGRDQEPSQDHDQMLVQSQTQ